MGGDLREVLATLKIVTDLERIGELAINVVRRARSLADRQVPNELVELADAATPGARDRALGAPRRRPRPGSRRAGEGQPVERAQPCSDRATPRARARTAGVELTLICRYLERIGDHAANVARRVVYAAEGVALPHLDETPVG